MLLSPSNTLPPYHHHPPDPTNLHSDPFQSIYDSFANLTLTPTTAPATTTNTDNQTPSPNHDQTQTQTQTQPAPLIPINLLFPPGDNVIFAHTSFFRRYVPGRTTNVDLPTPVLVREQAARVHGLLYHGGPPPPTETRRRMLVPFPELSLLVGYNTNIDNGAAAAEGKAMMLLRRAMAGVGGGGGGGSRVGIPVPEVFGWRREGGEGFVYMELPEGEVLEERWSGMSEAEKGAVCAQLREMVGLWRRLRHGGVEFVGMRCAVCCDSYLGEGSADRRTPGSVDYGPLRDEVLRAVAPSGPFPSVSAFHDHFVLTAATMSPSRHGGSWAGQAPNLPHHLFPVDVPIVFTHGCLHPRNILVSAGPNPRVVSIIGWEQAGWYPTYWELCKARRECSLRGGLGDWENHYLPLILDADGLNNELRDWRVGALCQYWDYFVGLM